MYLCRAVMCMRNDGIGCAPNLGVFLHELEDLVQVARIQKQVNFEVPKGQIEATRVESEEKRDDIETEMRKN